MMKKYNEFLDYKVIPNIVKSEIRNNDNSTMYIQMIILMLKN